MKEEKPILSKQVIMELQQIVGYLYFYAHMVDLTIMLIQLTYLGLHNLPHHNLVPLPPEPPLCVGQNLRISSKNRGVHGELRLL